MQERVVEYQTQVRGKKRNMFQKMNKKRRKCSWDILICKTYVENRRKTITHENILNLMEYSQYKYEYRII